MIFVIGFIILWLPTKLLFPTIIIGKKNLPKDKGFVLTCNHYSNYDPVLLDISFNRKIRFLAKKELFKNKFIGYIIKAVGGFPIDREKPEISSFKFALNAIKDKKALGIFPEGTRNKGDENELQDLKDGAIVFASKGDAEIVPVLMYKKPKIFRKNYLIVGKPFKLQAEDTKRLTKEETLENTKRLAQILNDMRKELDDKVNKGKKNAK